MKKALGLHKNNPHSGRYNFAELVESSPKLGNYLRDNPMGDKTIDFSNNEAVVELNKALIKYYYNIENWDIPQGFLCPPIPGRADYIHYASDLLKNIDHKINILDIGTGASCIYPIIGARTFDWSFTATDINKDSLENAQKIVNSNKNIKNKIKLKLQENKSFIFKDIIEENEYFDLVMCNPPFHGSLKEAQDSNYKKVRNLNKKKDNKAEYNLNFGGQQDELWCPGGEVFFLKKMVRESQLFKEKVFWFTSLVSKSDSIKPLRHYIRKHGAKRIKVIEMAQGNKISRIICWSFN